MQTMREAEATVTGERGYGGQSMTGRLRAVLVRRPAPPATGDEWRALGYPRPVDAAVAEREHAAFRALLAQAGARFLPTTRRS